MRIHKISADKIFDGEKFIDDNSVLVFDERGTLLDICSDKNCDSVRKTVGLICPGFVNTHCHLELSHLKNKISKCTGVPDFLLNVIKKRYLVNEDYLLNCIQTEIKNLEQQGVVAVGDICNNKTSIVSKKKSQIYFHNFVEFIGFDSFFNADKFDHFIKIYDTFEKEFKCQNSLSPHAPYSVSKFFFEKLKVYSKNKILSIHNQECEEENQLYEKKTGEFIDFYNKVNIDISFFKSESQSSIKSIFCFLESAKKLILVHNLFTTECDIKFIESKHKNVFYCLCPNSNLYIQKKVPDVNLLQKAGVKITIGTDSLASNDNLSIISEIKLLQKEFKYLSLKETLKWSTFNGAQALGIEDRIGSFKIGKRPGIVSIKDIVKKEDNYYLKNEAQSIKINPIEK